MRPLVVLPTYNESENIDRILRRVRVALPEAGVLVVDDGSPDGTADIAEGLGKELGEIEVLRRPSKAGLGSAYRAGFAWGLDRGFDAFVEMDADFSHDPDELAGLVAPLSEGVDLVVGSRYIPGGSIPNWSWHRRLLSQGGNVYASVLLGLHVTDSTSGFRAYGADILRRIDLTAVRADGYGFQIEMVHQVLEHGGNVTEVPIRFVDRVEGKSKMSAHIVVEALVLVTWWALVRMGRSLLRLGRSAATATGRDRSGDQEPEAVGSVPARRISPASARKPTEGLSSVPATSSVSPDSVPKAVPGTGVEGPGRPGTALKRPATPTGAHRNGSRRSG